MIFTPILRNLPKIWKHSPNCTFIAKNELPTVRIWKMTYHIIVYLLLNLNLARFVRKKPDSGSRKLDTWSRNLFLLKHIWVKISITWKFQPNWSNNTLKSGFFRISQIRNFFDLKPSRDLDGANKKSLAKSVQPFRRR